MGVIIVILFFAITIFITIKIANLKARAKQHLLKNTGFSYADVSGKVAGAMDDTKAKKFLNVHPEYTLESLKDLIKDYTTQMINRTAIKELSPKVVEKMQKDSKLDKIATMELKRVNISASNEKYLSGRAVYTDNRDEYEFELSMSYTESGFIVERYYIYRGAEVGF